MDGGGERVRLDRQGGMALQAPFAVGFSPPELMTRPYLSRACDHLALTALPESETTPSTNHPLQSQQIRSIRS